MARTRVDGVRAHGVALVALALAGVLAGCAVIDHFRYPTGKSDVRAYREAMAVTEVGMLRADFEALWAGDDKGHRILAIERETRDAHVVRRYYIGFTMQYMEAAGRDVDQERREVIVPVTPRDQDSLQLREAGPSTEFWTRVSVTDIVTCIDELVVGVARPDGDSP